MWREARLFRELAFAGVMAVASPCLAAEKFLPPYGVVLGCDGDSLNAVTMICTSTAPQQIHCTFTRLIVTKESPETARKNRNEFLQAVQKEAEQRGQTIRNACESLGKQSQIDFSKV